MASHKSKYYRKHDRCVAFENSQISPAATTKVLRQPMYPNTDQLKATKAYNYG